MNHPCLFTISNLHPLMNKNIYLLIVSLFCSSLSVAQTRYYVDDSASGMNNGSTWVNAFSSLHHALTAAQPGDEIWVAQGVYYPASDVNRDTFFNLPSGVRLIGGFLGNETDLTQRNWQANPSILSGDIGVSGDSTDNSYNIMILNNPDSLTLLDGFIFRSGNAGYALNDQPATSRYRCGGALFISGGWEALATIQNCRFERNNARNHGGAVYVNGVGSSAAAPVFRHCVFEQNIAGQDGGGVARLGDSDDERPDFDGCIFLQNKAGRFGGGLYFQGADVESATNVQHCQFIQNQSQTRGAGVFLRIGRPGGARARVYDCLFQECNDKEALLFMPLFGQDCREIRIEGCRFLDNKGNQIAYDLLGTPDSEMRITGCKFENKYSALTLVEGEIISNLILERDTVINFPSARITNANGENQTIWNRCFCTNIYSLGDFTNGFVSFTNLILEHSELPMGIANSSNVEFALQFRSCTFYKCSMPYLFSSGADSFDPTVLFNIENCIFDNSLVSYSESLLKEVKILSDYCLFDDTTICNVPIPLSYDYEFICGPNNFYGIDPMFRDTANGDYSLLPCSPIINAGSNAAAAGLLNDFAGGPRIQDGTVDIGAFESPAFALATVPEVKPACTGTSNGSISIQPAYGCEPLDYQWSPPAGNGPELNGLPPGQYVYTVTDGKGRQISDTLTIQTAPTPELSLQKSDVSCGLLSGGSLTASVSSGVAPFHYQWLPLAPDTSKLTHLPPGAYALTITDGNGCLDSASAQISLVGAITLQVSGQGISCFGAANGWLAATPVTGAAPFAWQWTGWPGTDSLAQPLGPGQYAVTVHDAY
ncbi:MAG TPA: SprB repeat-containing protein, partial [Saprospiraceae bacterium]|nr:SprB repeat-containing protein [Saprospiraceae bacterium]